MLAPLVAVLVWADRKLNIDGRAGVRLVSAPASGARGYSIAL